MKKIVLIVDLEAPWLNALQRSFSSPRFELRATSSINNACSLITRDCPVVLISDPTSFGRLWGEVGRQFPECMRIAIGENAANRDARALARSSDARALVSLLDELLPPPKAPPRPPPKAVRLPSYQPFMIQPHYATSASPFKIAD